MPPKSLPDPSLDPFGETLRQPFAARWPILGARCHFDSNDERLLNLAALAYSGLPALSMDQNTPDLHVRLLVLPQTAVRAARPAFGLMSGVGLLAAATASASFMTLSVPQRTALIAVSRAQVRHSHDVRYELIECAVFTLAARVQGLMPLHAACLARGGRGVLLVGDSGAGKSTLAWAALTRGLEFVAEDSVFVAPSTLRAAGVANFVHLRMDSPYAAAATRGARVIQRRSGVRKYEIDVRRSEFKLARRPVTLQSTVFLSTEPAGQRSLLTRVAPASARRRLRMQQPYAAARPGWSSFLQHLTSRPAYELRRARDPDAAIDAIGALLAP